MSSGSARGSLGRCGPGGHGFAIPDVHKFKGANLTMRPLIQPVVRRHAGIVTLADRTLSEAPSALIAHVRESFATWSSQSALMSSFASTEDLTTCCILTI
jgi:hypothetical protein